MLFILKQQGRFSFSHEETGRIVGADVKTSLSFFYIVVWVNGIISAAYRALLNNLHPTVEMSWLLSKTQPRSFLPPKDHKHEMAALKQPNKHHTHVVKQATCFSRGSLKIRLLWCYYNTFSSKNS